MRTFWIIAVLLVITGCATNIEPVTAKYGWDGRDIAELIAVVGPEDSVIINKESKSFNWFRFGDCRLTAYTSLDNKILNLETVGRPEGCTVYIQKIGRT